MYVLLRHKSFVDVGRGTELLGPESREDPTHAVAGGDSLDGYQVCRRSVVAVLQTSMGVWSDPEFADSSVSVPSKQTQSTVGLSKCIWVECVCVCLTLSWEIRFTFSQLSSIVSSSPDQTKSTSRFLRVVQRELSVSWLRVVLIEYSSTEIIFSCLQPWHVRIAYPFTTWLRTSWEILWPLPSSASRALMSILCPFSSIRRLMRPKWMWFKFFSHSKYETVTPPCRNRYTSLIQGFDIVIVDKHWNGYTIL